MFTKSSSTIDFIEDETTHKITDPQQICDLLNDFFTSVMTKTDHIDSGIPIPGPTPETSLSDRHDDRRRRKETHRLNEMEQMKWSGWNTSKSYEKVPNMIPWLCKLFEKSLRTGHCPQDWKYAHIAAIHKKE